MEQRLMFAKLCAILISGCVWYSLPVNASGKEPGVPPQNSKTQGEQKDKEFKIHVGVEEVRLDAVVLRKNHQATDLTEDDFEIYQDGKLQKVISCTYMNEYQPQEKIKTDSLRNSKAMPPVPAPILKREEVRRTFVFIVDNLTMPFEDVHFARMGLRRFVENEMQPGDLVAILQTAGGNAAIQMFTSDKRILLEKISNIKWLIDARTLKHSLPEPMAISYCIRALQDMPGHKYLMLITPAVSIPYGFANAFNVLADAALRAEVVIHTLPSSGLVFDEAPPAKECAIGNADCIAAIQRVDKPLSKKTGGLLLKNENWMVAKGGIGSVSEEIKGYYLLSYIPPPETFKGNLQSIYHRVRIRVKRSGYEVHTRDGFLGIPTPMFASARNSGSLQNAIFSPFQNSSLNINLSSGYIHDPQKGYQIKSWLHLDGKDLNIVEEKDGKRSLMLEAACVTSDMDSIQDSSAMRYEILPKKEGVPWIREHGLDFSLVLPVKKPGAYYVRVAVKDSGSGKIGSAYQFIEIPDLKKRRLTLSNIFFVNRDENLPWAWSTTPEEYQKQFYPDLRYDPRKSPALRNFLPDESIEYAAVIYNADTDKEQKPNLESQVTLFKDGKEIYRSEPAAVDLGGVNDFNRIPIRKKLTPNTSLQPGDYALLLQVKETQAKGKGRIAKQALDFKVLSK
jgi:VWFA-related protein